MLASRPASATLLVRPALWVGALTDSPRAAEVVAGEQHLPAEAGASRFVRFAELAVIGLNVLLVAVEFGRLLLAPASATRAELTLLATACALPLHIRHVVYGLR